MPVVSLFIYGVCTIAIDDDSHPVSSDDSEMFAERLQRTQRERELS